MQIGRACGLVQAALCNKAVGLLVVLFMLIGGVYGCQSMAVKMTDAQQLYSAKCSSCHNLIAPHEYDKAAWQAYIDKYGDKMTDHSKLKLLEYLGGSED